MTKKLAIIGILGLAACGSPDTNNNAYPPADTVNIPTHSQLFEHEQEREEWRRGIVFHWLWDSTYYKNPAEMTNRLDTFYGLIAEGGKLSAPQCHSLFGYKDSIYLLEYVYPNDSSCDNHPYRQQFIFDAEGHLLQELQLQSLQSLAVWQGQSNLLVGIETSCEGEGTHLVYKYENGELINIFNTLNIENTPITYKNKADSTIYLPAELKLSLADINQDGWNDLVFEGQKAVLIDEKGKQYSPKRPFKTTPLRYQFIYHPGKEVFLK